LRLWPSFAAYLFAEENERGDEPKEVAAVEALLMGEALVSCPDVCPDEATLGHLLALPIAFGVVSMCGTAGRMRVPWR
jgi:hypothetical protein